MFPTLLALAFIAILFIVIIAGQPDEFKTSRSAKISAPRENFSACQRPAQMGGLVAVGKA
ncbi:MAG: hypothetical protein WDM76_01450 [Limisphaerales bacterium]